VLSENGSSISSSSKLWQTCQAHRHKSSALLDRMITTISSLYDNMRTITLPTIVFNNQNLSGGLLSLSVGEDDAARTAHAARVHSLTTRCSHSPLLRGEVAAAC